MLQIIIFSAVAGICGTGIGGVISAALLKKPSDNLTCWMLSFAAGVMTSIVCFGLVQESLLLASAVVTVFGIVLGIVVVMVLNRFVDNINQTNQKPHITNSLHNTAEEFYHESRIIANQKKMFQSGILMFLVIGLHNLPEGMAIGAGGSLDFNFGLLLAIMIALHNIPEGMAIATPLLAGGVSKWRVIILTAISGVPTLLGGLLGFVIGNISGFAIAMCLSAAGGAMLYVVFGEIVPQAVVLTKNRTATIITMFGIIIGFIVTKIHL